MKVNFNLAYYLLIIASIHFITGCASAPKPPIATISLNAQKDINPNQKLYEDTELIAKPVVIRVYELKSLAAFNSSDFFSAFNNYRETLGPEHLNSEEFQLQPGKKMKFDLTLNFDTRYIGVIAAFRDLEHAQWRASAPLPVKEKAPEVYVFLKENTVKVGTKKACGFFCQLFSPKPPEGTLYEEITPN